MKVAFTFSGLPHYLIALLNRLVSEHGIELSLIIPKERGLSLGQGIRIDAKEKDYLFSIHRLDEFRGKFNKPYFKNLHLILDEIAPDILVIGWPYIINFYFDFKSRKTARKNNISLVYREIPFMVAPRNRAISYYKKYPVLNEDLSVGNPAGLSYHLWAFGLNQMRKRYYKMVDATLIYASHGYEIQESFGISRDKIFLTYNSPDTEEIAKIRNKVKEQGNVARNPVRILHLGRLVKWKRVDLLIEAVARLSSEHESLELIIIGAGPEEENLKELARRKAPGVSIKFLGAIYDAETLAGEIMSSSIYVLGGMGGLSINEAMAYGLPVICSRCDGTERDLVVDGVNGLFFQEGDVIDLASKIEILLTDTAKCQAMGAHALSHIEKKINLETVTQRFVNCFHYLMQSKQQA